MGLGADLLVFGGPGPVAAVRAPRARRPRGPRTLFPVDSRLPAHPLHDHIAAARRRNPVLTPTRIRTRPCTWCCSGPSSSCSGEQGGWIPFSASHLAWIDLADPSRLASRRPRLRAAVQPGPPAGDERVPAADWRTERTTTRSARTRHPGYITPTRPLSAPAAEFDELARSTMEGFAPSEEQLLPVLSTKHRAFEFHYGDYDRCSPTTCRCAGAAGNLLFQLRVTARRRAAHDGAQDNRGGS